MSSTNNMKSWDEEISPSSTNNGDSQFTVEVLTKQTDGGEQSQRPKVDAFLLYSVKENLDRARNFEPVDYGTLQQLPGEIQRKTRISFEKDFFRSLVEDMEDGGESDGADPLDMVLANMFE